MIGAPSSGALAVAFLIGTFGLICIIGSSSAPAQEGDDLEPGVKGTGLTGVGGLVALDAAVLNRGGKHELREQVRVSASHFPSIMNWMKKTLLRSLMRRSGRSWGLVGR